jgi:ketosteroid isomerase-like protein
MLRGDPLTEIPAGRVLDALERNDLDPGFFHEDAVAWRNLDDSEQPIHQTFEATTAIRAVIPDFHFGDRVLHAERDGVSVAQYHLAGTLPDGSSLRVLGCLVVHTVDGRVRRTEEYFDTAQLAPMRAALAAPS